MKTAPTEETKMTAVELRQMLADMIELSIENDWSALREQFQFGILMCDKLRLDDKTTLDLAA